MIRLIKKYLDLNLYQDKESEFEELFFSHPNYPSVFAITDTLDLLSVENVALKVPKEQIEELPNFFLAIYKGDLVLVEKKEKSILFQTEDGLKTDLSIDDFCKVWSGIIIAIESNQYINSEVQFNSKLAIYLSPILVLIALSIFYNGYSLINSILLCTSIVGVLIGIFIVREKFGLKNEIVSKFCNISPNTSCDSVIQSQQGKINKWMSLTDLPLLFFSVNLLSILLNPTYSSKIISLLSIASLPLIVYSIWLQKFQIKKWCMLCMAVSVILVLQVLVSYFIEQPILNDGFFRFFSYVFSLIVCSSLWFTIKPVLETNIEAQSEVKELKKFKRSYAVFDFLSNEVPVKEGFSKLQGLKFGSSTSNIALSIFLSPSCIHCHKTFEDSIQVVNKYPEKVSLNVFFNINPENENNPFKVVVENLLEISYAFPDKIEEAISDWHIHKMGLEGWLKKWKQHTISIKVNQQLQQQYDWCLENEFNYAPVKIVNGKLFPNEYNISELKYFINDFSEEKEFVEIERLVQL